MVKNGKNSIVKCHAYIKLPSLHKQSITALISFAVKQSGSLTSVHLSTWCISLKDQPLATAYQYYDWKHCYKLEHKFGCYATTQIFFWDHWDTECRGLCLCLTLTRKLRSTRLYVQSKQVQLPTLTYLKAPNSSCECRCKNFPVSAP